MDTWSMAMWRVFGYKKIFRLGMESALHAKEKVVADKGYKDESCVTPLHVSGEQREICATIRARHETCNRRLKQFRVLGDRFRHHRSKRSALLSSRCDFDTAIDREYSTIIQLIELF